MLRTQLFDKPNECAPVPKEGALYKVIEVHGQTFEIYYGYYDERERKNPTIEPMPIYPDFQQHPCYTDDGYAFVTKMQDICQHYAGAPPRNGDCAECSHYLHGDELLGICTCIHRKKQVTNMEKKE